MAFPLATHSYLLGALENGPAIMDLILGGYAESDPIWDYRPDPSRFTLREMIAHLADWNPIYLERLQSTLREDNPTLPNRDEGRIAEERDYAHSDPVGNLRRYRETRAEIISFVKGFTEDDWSRPAIRENVGALNMGEQVALLAAHDAYHLRQALAYTNRGLA